MSNPSLILPQSPAYGEDYVYAAQVNDGVVPLYNVLPLTFTRASGGTRINKDGLVQDMPYNLLSYSEDFTNAFWNKATNGSATFTVTANQTTAPNGTNTADLISITRSATSELSCVYTMVGQGVGTFKGSIWLKAKDSSNVGKTIDLWSWEGDTRGYTKVTLTADWVRYDQNTTVFTGTGSELFDFGLLPISYSTSTTLAVEFYAWGAQSNIGSTAQPYLATTDRLNMPRITYPVGGGCGALLLEKQSTNLATYSEDATQWNAGSNVGSITVTANQTISPDGTQNADKVVFPAVGSPSQYAVLFFPFTASATTYSGTFYLKGNVGGEVVWISFTKDGVNYTQQLCTLTTSWQRFNLTSTLTSGADNFQIGVDTRDSSQSAKPSQTIYVWGRQLEASSYATSYIPTTSTSATRIADSCYKTGISNLIGQTEGTVFLNVNYATLSGLSMFLSIRPNPSNKVEVYRDGGTIYGEVTSSASFAISATKAVGTHKIAFAYKSGDSALYIDGVLIGQNTTAFTYSATLSDLYINERSGGAFIESANYNDLQLFTTRLSNAELATLTTL